MFRRRIQRTCIDMCVPRIIVLLRSEAMNCPASTDTYSSTTLKRHASTALALYNIYFASDWEAAYTILLRRNVFDARAVPSLLVVAA
jgi:hypothetical protein